MLSKTNIPRPYQPLFTILTTSLITIFDLLQKNLDMKYTDGLSLDLIDLRKEEERKKDAERWASNKKQREEESPSN